MLHLLELFKKAPTRVWEGAEDEEELHRMIKEDIMKPSGISLRKKKKGFLKTLLSVSSNKQ